MNNFEVIIGIENHVELKTKSKMFGPGPVGFGATPNTLVSEVDMGYPGALPSVNKEGVKLAILASHALNMKIDTLLKFDRKNYFYPDLVKGFQITQQFNPIGSNGYLNIKLSDGSNKKVEIERLHIEEDTAKQTHKNDLTYIDYNRSGIGLIEIVTKPVLRSSDEACAYVEKLRETLLFLGVSDVKMNEGSLRCDVNISIRPFGSKKFSNRVEIKNLNSIANVKKAIEFEINRQSKLLLTGKNVEQETRRFDEDSQQTIMMRSKADAVDYRYFPEPNISPIQLDKKWVDDVIKNSSKLSEERRINYIKKYSNILTMKQISFAASDYETSLFIDNYEKLNNETKRKYKNLPILINFLANDIEAIRKENKQKNKFSRNNNSIMNDLIELINLILDGVISTKHAKIILPMIIESDKKSPIEISNELNLKVISNIDEIKSYLNPIIENNLDLLKQYNDRPDRVTKTIMGQLMKETHGNVNPDIGMQLIIDIIKQKIN